MGKYCGRRDADAGAALDALAWARTDSVTLEDLLGEGLRRRVRGWRQLRWLVVMLCAKTS